MQGGANVQDARREMTKTKEQLEEEKKISLSIRIKPLDVDAMDSDQLGANTTSTRHSFEIPNWLFGIGLEF